MASISVLPARGFRAQLREAMTQKSVVRVWRDDLETGNYCGFVGGVGAEFFLLWVIADDLSFGGLQVLRHVDVTRVEAPDEHHHFYKKALAAQNLLVWFPENFNLDNAKDMVASANKLATVISVEVDEDTEDMEGLCFFVGEVVDIPTPSELPEGFAMREIDPDGEWAPISSYFGWDEILGLTICDNYARTLYAVAQASDASAAKPVKQRT